MITGPCQRQKRDHQRVGTAIGAAVTTLSVAHGASEDVEEQSCCNPKITTSPPSGARVRISIGSMSVFRRGDFSVRLPRGLRGIDGEIAEAFNDVVELNDRMTKEFERLGDTVGKQGKISHRAKLPARPGSWAATSTRSTP